MVDAKPKTHRLEFDVKLLLQSVPCVYGLVSNPSDTVPDERKITASIGIKTTEGNLTWQVSPWMHSNISRVSIFFRRQDPHESAHVGKLKRILEQHHIPYDLREMRR